MIKSLDRWDTVPWAQVQGRVRAWQEAIYNESVARDFKRVRWLQHRVVSSLEAKLLATRRVTEDNVSVALAGVDGIARVPPSERLALARSLTVGNPAMPLRHYDDRVERDRVGRDHREPGVPTIHDRCMQTLFVLALEPEWEAIFEPNSYARVGRNPHDATKAMLSNIIKGQKYAYVVDVAGCFDSARHGRRRIMALLEKTGLRGKLRRQVKAWLVLGVLDGTAFSGYTPLLDGSVGTAYSPIAPLLANIALHGLEDHLKAWVGDLTITRSSGRRIANRRDRMASLHVVRYGYDFVVVHADRAVVHGAPAIVKRWLDDAGLELSAGEERLTHTLRNGDDDTPADGFSRTAGFDFLGFTFKQFVTKHRSNKTAGRRGIKQSSPKLGYRTLVYPSKAAINRHQANLHDIVLRRGKGLAQDVLIQRLNPVIVRWSAYYGVSYATVTGHLSKQNNLLYLKLRRWSKRRTGSAKAGLLKYWSRREGRRWVFQSGGYVLMQHEPPRLVGVSGGRGGKKTPRGTHQTVYRNRGAEESLTITMYTRMVGQRSPYDGDNAYWLKRRTQNPRPGLRKRILLARQNGCCNLCELAFDDNDVMEVDHIIPKKADGGEAYTNFQLLHRHCHHAKTSRDARTMPTPAWV